MSSSVNLFLFLEAANSGIDAMSDAFLLGIKSIDEGENELEEEEEASSSFDDSEEGNSAGNATDEVNAEEDKEGGSALKESTSNEEIGK
jgi:hypothetical protein